MLPIFCPSIFHPGAQVVFNQCGLSEQVGGESGLFAGWSGDPDWGVV